MKKILIILAIVIVAAGLYLNQKPKLPEPVQYSDVIASEAPDDAMSVSLPETAPRNDSEAVPSVYNLAVPFQPQAPYANWELPYQEACEEASLIMAAWFFIPGLSGGPEHMDAEILDLVLWEKERFGYYEDTTAAEVAAIADEYFGLNAALDYDVSVENIKRHIASNKLVVVPAAGRELPNPYFTGDGPLYHMLVIRGYTATQFITNDPGTRRGEEFLYRYDDLINAIADWPRPHGGFKDNVTDEEMRNGTPVLIVLDR